MTMSPMDEVSSARYKLIVNDLFTMMICPIHSLISQSPSPWSLGAGSLYQDDRGECDADWVGRHLGTESLSSDMSLSLVTKITEFLLQEWMDPSAGPCPSILIWTTTYKVALTISSTLFFPLFMMINPWLSYS